MGDVKRLFPDKMEPIEFLDETVRTAIDQDDDPVEGMLVAAKTKSGNWLLGYCKLGFADRMEATSHIHCDVIDMMIKNNPERYGLHTHDD